MSIHIQSFYDDIPYEKEIYLLLSSRKLASGETLFNYRQKLFEMIEAMDLKIKDPKIKK